jgi:hypothetical protein
MVMVSRIVGREAQRDSAMQSYVSAVDGSSSGLGLVERVARNASIAGLAGVALSGAVTLVPLVPRGSATQWVCAGVGTLLGVVLAFFPRQAAQPAR